MVNISYSMICSLRVNRTAVIRLHSLGDVVLAQPVASELSKTGEVFFLTSEEYEPVIARMPGNIHPVLAGSDTGPAGLRKLIGKISPDSVVDLQNNFASRVATLGKPLRGRFHMDRKLRKKVLDHSAESMPMRAQEFMTSAGFEQDCDPVLDNNNESDSEGLRVGIVTGGRWHLKSIPIEVISETSKILSDIHGADIVLLGGREDRELILRTTESTVSDSIEVYSGEEGVQGLIESIEKLDVLISPDSGPAHLASALGIPVLVVFTSTSPALGFWRDDRKGNYMVSNLSCRPCQRHGGNSCPNGTEICRKGILPFHLAEKAMELLGT
jgi:ADP-heptose:LPS heptosyltransferase